jgi:hypothetical protein
MYDLSHLYKAYSICEKCSKWKRLYLEEKKKYEDLKKWTEELIKTNNSLLEHLKTLKID